MNLDNLNKWLTLAANLGVLIGIIAVVVQLQQTQQEMQQTNTGMRAEASTLRTQMAIENGNVRRRNRLEELIDKVSGGQELNVDEEILAREWQMRMLRYFENLHYQQELGVLDDEIWEANLNGISEMCSRPMFKYLLPNWRNSFGGSTFRSSFVDLVMSPCENE